jgi:hypothetical protein
MTHDELIDDLIAHRKLWGADQSARMLGVSRTYLSDVIAGRRMRPEKAKPDPILTALRLRRVVTYEPMEPE